MPRVFLALNFSVAVTRKLAEEIERRRAPLAQAGFRVTWVPPANLHLTVRFLGSIAEELVEGVAGACRRVAASHSPFEARPAGVGAFPSLERPSVLWFGVEAPPALSALQGDLEAAMVGLGFAREERAFHPHITAGRVKSGPGAIGELWSGGIDCGPSSFHEVVIYESRTRSAGAEYVALARVPLGTKEQK